MSNPLAKEIVTVADVAKFLGVPKKRVYAMLRRGAASGLQSFRVGRSWRIDLEQLRLWLSRQVDDADQGDESLE